MTPADRIVSHSAQVGVIGLGYVGLTLAVEIARAGFSVVGLEKDMEKVRQLREEQSYIEDVPQDSLAALIREGQLEVTTDSAVCSLHHT